MMVGASSPEELAEVWRSRGLAPQEGTVGEVG